MYADVASSSRSSATSVAARSATRQRVVRVHPRARRISLTAALEVIDAIQCRLLGRLGRPVWPVAGLGTAWHRRGAPAMRPRRPTASVAAGAAGSGLGRGRARAACPAVAAPASAAGRRPRRRARRVGLVGIAVEVRDVEDHAIQPARHEQLALLLGHRRHPQDLEAEAELLHRGEDQRVVAAGLPQVGLDLQPLLADLEDLGGVLLLLERGDHVDPLQHGSHRLLPHRRRALGLGVVGDLLERPVRAAPRHAQVLEPVRGDHRVHQPERDVRVVLAVAPVLAGVTRHRQGGHVEPGRRRRHPRPQDGPLPAGFPSPARRRPRPAAGRSRSRPRW